MGIEKMTSLSVSHRPGPNTHEDPSDPEPAIRRSTTTSHLATAFSNSYIGIISLFSMILCAAASAIVIGVSHNATIDAWRIQPAVILAIFSAASNIAFASALTTGVAVRYWLSVSRGASLSQLHYIWEHGHGLGGFFSGLRAGSHARNVVLLATLASTMQFVSGPLLQRSTHQISQDRVSFETMRMDLATAIPDGWLGNIQNGEVVGFRRGMLQTQRWWKNETMLTRNQTSYTCNGICDGYVKGAGLTQHCWTSEYLLDLTTTATDNQTVFQINTTRADNGTDKPYLRLKTTYLSAVNDSCMSTITITTCDIESATVLYPVTIQGQVISLRRSELTTMTVLSKSPSPGDVPTAPDGARAGPLAGLDYFATSYLQDNTIKQFNAVLNRTIYWGEGGLLSDIFLHPRIASFYDFDGGTDKPDCRLEFSGPTEYILEVFHEWTFRAALNIVNSTRAMEQRTSDQKFIARRTVPDIVFNADLRYLSAAIASTIWCLVFVGSLMWGWWRLNRRVTMSPIETANAFGAPIMMRHRVRPDASIEQILKTARDVEFRGAAGR